MYEHRYQKQLLPILALAWRLATRDGGGLAVLWGFLLLQLAGVANRFGWNGLADRVRARLPFSRVERTMSRLLATDFRFVVTEVGGCAVDIDNEEDYDASCARFDEWMEVQRARGEALYGALPERAGSPGGSGPPSTSPAADEEKDEPEKESP
jgi:hypothetical protein